MISAGKSGSNELRDTAAEVGTVTPVDNLKDKGIRKIRVLSESQLAETLQVAVNRVLRNQLDDVPLPAEARQMIERRAAKEFDRLRRQGLEAASARSAAAPEPQTAPEPQATAEPMAPTPPIDLTPPPIPEELEVAAPQPHAVDDRSDVDPALARDLLNAQKALAELSGQRASAPDTLTPDSADSLREMESRMAENISSLLAQNLKREMAKVENSHREQVSLLELRIAKLASALESTDRALQSLQSVRSHGDQPENQQAAVLDPSSPLFAKKSQLLDALFQANLVLRELQSSDSEG